MNLLLITVIFLISTSLGTNIQDIKHSYEKLSERSFTNEDDCKSAVANDLRKKRQFTSDYIDKVLSDKQAQWKIDIDKISEIIQSNNEIQTPEQTFKNMVNEIRQLNLDCVSTATENVNNFQNNCEKINPDEWRINLDKENKTFKEFQLCVSKTLQTISNKFKEYLGPKFIKTKIIADENSTHIGSDTTSISIK